MAASGNDLQLTFDDDAGGLNAAGDVGTGFTMVQPSSSDPTYYVPQNIQVANGSLNIAATKGIAYLKNGTAASDIDKNKQDNTLGVGLTASDNVLRFTTTLKSPSTSTSSAQAGIWFGPTDDDYVKLVLASPSDTGRQIQLSREVAGVTNQAVNGDQRNLDISKAALGDQDVQLILDVNSVTKSAIASYKIGAGAVTSLGTLPLPTNFFDGTLLSADVPNVDSFGGLFATKRNMAATTPLTYSFQDFSVSELDATAPAAPGAVTAGATPDSVELTWAAPADADVAGYRVYRSGTTPVATTGTPVSGAGLITDPSFVDESAFVGGTYHYSVVAVDTSGNTSAAAESGAAVPPAPPGTLVDKINFQPSAANAPDDYSADTGAAYDAARGSGWITEDDRTPFDFSLNTRSRTGNPDPRLSSIIHMQYGDIASASPTTGVTAEKGVWEYDVPNGTYNVVAAAGDTGAGVTNGYDSKHMVRAEGTVVLEEFVGSAPRQFDEAVGTVEVTDGKLTIDAIGGSNTKLAYIDIYSVTQEAPVPAAPAALQGEAGASGVVLEWTASEGAAGYNVYRGTTAEVAVDGPALNGNTPVSGVTFTDESAAADTTYYYVVTAVNDDGAASEASSAVEVQVPAETSPVPAAPAGLQGEAGASGVVLEWTASEGAAGYNVYRGTTAEVAVDGPALNGNTPVSGVTFTDEGAAADTTYYYVVTAVNEERSASDPSPAVRVAVPAEGGPEPGSCAVGQWEAEFFLGQDLGGAPVKIECADDINQEFADGAGPEGVASNDYSIRWTKTVAEGAGTYEFKARTDDGVRIKVDGELVLDKWFGQSATETYTVAALLPESAVVEVEYFQGYGKASADVSYTRLGADTEAPAAPSQLVAAAEGSAVALSWEVSASTDTVGYRVYRGTEAGVEASETPLSGSPLVESAGYRDVSAAPDVTYYYVVTAVDAAGNESEVSNEAMAVVATVEDTEAPDAPLELAAVAGDASVELTWTASASTDTAGYRVYRSLQPVVADTGEEDAVSGEALVSGTAYTDDTVSNGTTYFYVVTAVDTAGNESEVSNEVFAVPTVPNTTDVKVDFTATNAVPAAGYLADWGQSYGLRTSPNQGTGLSYGWLSEDGTPVSLVGNGRERARPGIDGRLNSILHMQYGDLNGTNGVNTEGVWELAVPNGLYEVEVAVGDEPGASNVYDSNHVINIEAGLGIESFQATAGAEYRTSTTTVGVWDGALTLTATGGTNTKIAYVEVLGLEQAPHVDTMRPDNRASGHDPNDGVSATIRVPYAGVGVDPQTLPGNVHIYEAASGVEVPSSTGTSGGNDVISTQPDSPLKPNTSYRFVVTDEVKDNFGAPFVPFSSIFTTGAGTVETPEEFTPLSGVGFEKVELPIGAGTYWSTFTFGPDDKLYGATIGQGLFRFTVNDDGTLSNKEDLGYQGRAMVGLVFDKSSTASDLKLWITSTSANVGNEQGQWISGISRLTGANLQNEAKIFEGLPRSQSDHLTNSMVYGPDGRLYFQQGSNQAAGDLDNSWGQRGEKLLTAATLVFDPANPQVQAAASGAGSINVQTADGGSYNPYATNAPLKIYATGIRNAYDLVWHSNGHLYVPTNGTAGGGNSPGVTANADGTFTRVAAPGIPGASTVNGRDVTAQCQRRNYTGGSVPAVANHPTQRDLLFDVVEGGYYGHPNPERCEWVLNEGNDPANLPESPGQGGSKYASGVKADPNYRGIAYDFEFNKSPNGALEYQSDTFGGQLKGRLLVTRFSNNNDLIFLQPDPATGEILGAQVPTGVPGVPNTTISGADGFNDPLEVVEDPGTGNLYVNQYDRSGGAQKMFLLRVPADQQAATLDASAEELVFSAVKNTTSSTKALTVTNTGPEAVTLSRAVQGAQAGEFTITGGSTSLAAGASTTLQVAFKPGSAVGQRSATLEVTAGDTTLEIGLYGLSMNGIEGGNEPTFADVLGTLGYKVDVGWTNLAGGVDPAAKGDEVLEPLFVKSGSAPVSMKPLAQYAPREDLPFGWYTGDGTESERNKVGSIDINGYQSLLPPASPGSASSFDPGDEQFGFYFYSNVFQRVGFTEDRLNTGIAHRARVYPAKDRSGAAMANSYIVAFEDASNGDYQDYVFLVQGVKPAGEVTPPSTEAIRVNFSDLAGPLPAGYLRDHGQAFGTRTASDQGTGLSYGWKSQATENPLDISTGGTTPGNGRTRVTAQTDQRLESLMHMQSGDISGTFNGVATYAYWEIALPDGEYRVTVAAGDSTVNTSDLEAHTINLENQPVISRFVPTGAAGANSRHATATADVAVTDGFLTVDANGGTNSKINYLDIVPLADTEVPGDDPTDGAQVKVNFQTPAAPTPAGWIADTGMAFDAERKFGWLVDGAPTDRSSAARYRTTATPGINYPADNPLLQTTTLMGPATNVSTGVWEYELPNGTYKVALSVGDSGFLDSTHGVAVEGQPLVNSFVPTGATPFQTGTRDVAVADGKLTVTSTGTNSKINWISIKGDGLDGPPAATTEVKYNFQTEAAPTPAGWIKDYGLGYSAATGFGWLVGGEPADRVLGGRYRTAAASGITYPANDPLLQTLNIMQGGTVTGLSDGTWVADVADGTYTVSVSVGDAGFLDSTHAIEVEGTPVVDPFVPTGSAPFKTGTAQVTVTDGQLTVVPTGTNTKINWITIAGKALTAPSVAVTVNGTEVGSSFSGGTANVSLAASAPTGTTIESLTYSVNGADPVAYTAPFVFDAAGDYVLEVTATDTTGASTTRTVQFEVLDIGGTLTLRNEQATRQGGAPIPGLSEDWLVMHRINGGVSTHKVVDEATVTLSNTGSKGLRITELSLGGPNAGQFTVIDAPELPFTVQPNASVPVTVKFTAASGGRGVRVAQLNVRSSDPSAALTPVQLRGAYMTQPEGGSELSVNEIAQAFGWTTDLGSPSNGDEMRASALNGEEVRSLQWKRLDSSIPVTARQIAAFHGCCTQIETVNINGTTATHNAAYGQSLLPLNNALTGPTQLATNPTGNIGIVVSGQSTNNPNYMAVKTWPVRDRDRKIVPGAWIVGHDYISSPNQCGTGPTNCDFQDNMYLVTNMVPVASSDTAAPSMVTGVTAAASGSAIDVAWAAGPEADLAGYYVERATSAAGPWTRISGNTPVRGLKMTDTNLPFAAQAFYRVQAVDASGNTSPVSATASAAIPASAGQAIRINAGGGAVTTGGVNWLADTYFAGGKAYTNPAVAQIAGTDSDALYFSERSATTGPGTFGYNIPVPAGNYTVRLHFAEIYHGATGGGAGGTGKRVFGVNLEGGPQEVSNLDLNAVVSPMTAHIVSQTLGVTDGNLDIDLASTVDQPKISAIEVIRNP